MNAYQILTINPGSTSTKVALFSGADCVFSINVRHDAARLAQFPTISDQLPYRKQTILDALAADGRHLDKLDAVVGRGGGLLPVAGGTYRIGDVLLDHAVRGANGIQHPAQLGPQLAVDFAARCHCPAFVVNPPDTDELQDVARVTGVRGQYRNVHLHALNLKETAIRHAASMGRRYETCCFVVCHIGGGISVSAHRYGRMIDGNDIVGGEGPMAPTRCGALPASAWLSLRDELPREEVEKLCTKTGGLVNHLGTSDAIEVTERIAAGDRYAKLIWESMLYQITKEIGAMAAALHGRVDGILLGGGMVHSQQLVAYIKDACGWIAPVTAYPGEFEMEAMAAGAARVLSGEETAKTYTGQPVWNGFFDLPQAHAG